MVNKELTRHNRCQMVASESGVPPPGAFVHKVHEPLGLGRGQVDVIGIAVSAGDADGETPATGREHGLALGRRAQGG
jgi:hypothetical protein